MRLELLLRRDRKTSDARKTRNLYPLGRDSIIDQLPARILACDQVECHRIASPPFPKTVTRIRYDRDQRNAIGEIQLLKDPGEDVLREWMNADHDVWTPALKKIHDITDAPLMEKLARLRPDAVHAPVKVFHPVLPVAQNPVVQTY